MIITYHGFGFVKIQSGEKVVAFNPVGKSAEFKPARFGADLALISLNDSYYNGVETVTLAPRVPFVIDGPGEYEVDDIFIKGLLTPGPEGEPNTIYWLVWDGIKLAHLGAICSGNSSTAELAPEVKEELGEVDIVFVPVDSRIIAPKIASQLALSLNPKLIIPVNHGVGEPKDSLPLFLNESGVKSGVALDKLVLKKKDLEGKEGEVVIIKSF